MADAGRIRVWRSLPSGVLYFRARDLRCGRPDLETNMAGGGDVFSLMKTCPFRLYKSSVIDQKLGPVYRKECRIVLIQYRTRVAFFLLFFFVVTTPLPRRFHIRGLNFKNQHTPITGLIFFLIGRCDSAHRRYPRRVFGAPVTKQYRSLHIVNGDLTERRRFPRDHLYV